MKFVTKTINVKTNSRNELINITREIQKTIDDNDITNGTVVLFVPHTTAAITINENADPDVKNDITYGLSQIIPDLKAFKHFEGNSQAHIKSTLVGVDKTILLENKKIILGTWQGIYFCEFDGPRNRRLVIRISGE